MGDKDAVAAEPTGPVPPPRQVVPDWRFAVRNFLADVVTVLSRNYVPKELRKMGTILEQDGLRINFEPGSTRKVIVSFTGLQLRPGLGIGQKGEFWQTRMHEDKLHPIFYLHDKKNSWYEANYPLILERLPALLKPFDEMAAIGNSMGGFAAIRFSGFLARCRQVIAFSPQYSLHPNDVMGRDPRMMSYRSRVKEWNLGNAWSAPNKRARYFIFFGADDAYDAWHAQSFQRVIDERARVYMIGGSDHDVAAMLKRRGVLDPMLDMIINRDCSFDDVERLLREAGVEVRDSATIEFKPPPAGAPEAASPPRRARPRPRPSLDAG